MLLNVVIFAAIYYQREKRATYTKKKEELTEAENHHSSSTTSLERYHQKGSRKSSLQSVSGAAFGEYSCYDEKLRSKEKRALADLCTTVELPMQEYKYSPPCGSTTGSRRSITPENHYGNKHSMESQDAYTAMLPIYTAPPQINDANNLVTYRTVMIPKTELCNQATQADSPPPKVHDASTIVDENDQDLSPLHIPSDMPPAPRSSLQSSSGILRQGSGAPPTTPSAKKRVQIQEISV